MTKTSCDICGTDLTLIRHYQVGEICKQVPESRSHRIYFKDADHEVGLEDTGWVHYMDLHMCERCFNQPIVLPEHIRELRT